jgi:cellulose synthase/poly-beta-1,6-N-acetylglucosamine synthase-like glycosyltransferase
MGKGHESVKVNENRRGKSEFLRWGAVGFRHVGSIGEVFVLVDATPRWNVLKTIDVKK